MSDTRIPAALSGVTTCRIVTRGRVSGAEHAVTVWFAPVGDRLYVAVRGGLRSDWLQNALAQERVSVGRRHSAWPAGVALVTDPDESRRAVEAFAAKYAQHSFVIRAWRADAPTFARLVLAG